MTISPFCHGLLGEFPELGDRKVTVGLTATPGVDGLAVADEMLVRLNVNRRRVPYFTIGHELMHLLQRPGLGVVPAGEVLALGCNVACNVANASYRRP